MRRPRRALAAAAATLAATPPVAADADQPARHDCDRHCQHQRQIRRIEPYVGWVGGDGWPAYRSRFAVPPCIVNAESHGLIHEESHPYSSSGLYQIEAATWVAYGGRRFAPLAYLASKLEQSLVAGRIWNHGNGASNWTTAAGCGF